MERSFGGGMPMTRISGALAALCLVAVTPAAAATPAPPASRSAGNAERLVDALISMSTLKRLGLIGIEAGLDSILAKQQADPAKLAALREEMLTVVRPMMAAEV